MDSCIKNILEARFSRTFQLRLVLDGILVGAFAGLSVCLYRMGLSQAEQFLRTIRGYILGNNLLLVPWILILGLILLIVGRLMIFEPYTRGSGIPQIDAEVIGKADMPWFKVLSIKFTQGVLCALAGLSLGREGPSVQIGGMSAKGISRIFKKSKSEENILVTCGAGAGMAAAFHAPLTGVIFALEEIHKVFNAPLLISVMVSCTVSDFLVSQTLGLKPVLAIQFGLDLPHSTYPLLCLLGVILGLLGALHNKGMFYIQGLYSKLKLHDPYLKLIIPFCLALIALIFFPEFLCGGDAILETLESIGPSSVSMLCFLLIGKYFFTAVSFGSSAPGGTLFPLVILGLLSGALFGTIAITYTGIESSYITNFMVLGIAGLFSAVVRAPVTGIVLAFELTGTLDSLLSVSIISIIAYVCANITRVEPFYEKLLEDYLRKSQKSEPTEACERAHLSEKTLLSFVIQPGSILDSSYVKDVVWPDNSLIVTVERQGREIIPDGMFELQPLDRVLLITNKNSVYECDKLMNQLVQPQIGR